MFRLFEWIYGSNSFVPIDKRPVFEGNVIVRLILIHGKPYIPCQSLLLSTETTVLNDCCEFTNYIYSNDCSPLS